MCSAYKLNEQGDNIQPWRTPFPIWSQSVVPCPVLTVASWPAYRFLRRQVRWSGIPISFRIFHSLWWSTPVKGFGIVNKAEIDVFLELSCFFDDPVDVSNLISGSCAFSKISLSIWKFTVHVLLKPGLENFEHYFTSMGDECNCAVIWAFFCIAFLWDWNENWSNLRTYKGEDKAWLEIIAPHPKHTHSLQAPAWEIIFLAPLEHWHYKHCGCNTVEREHR